MVRAPSFDCSNTIDFVDRLSHWQYWEWEMKRYWIPESCIYDSVSECLEKASSDAATMMVSGAAYDALIAENEKLKNNESLLSKGCAELRQANAELIEALKSISKVKYGLEISDYNDLKCISKYWADKALQYEEIALEALAKHGGGE